METRAPYVIVGGFVLAAIAAFLPSGAGIVLLPAVAFLAIDRRWGAALFLGLWTVALFLGDTVLRSLLAKRRAEVSTAATLSLSRRVAIATPAASSLATAPANAALAAGLATSQPSVSRSASRRGFVAAGAVAGP